MRAEALALLDKARENLQASRTLIDAGFFCSSPLPKSFSGGPAHHPAILGRLDYSHPVMEQNPARVTPRRDRIFPRFLYTPAYRPSLALFFCFPVFPQRQ